MTIIHQNNGNNEKHIKYIIEYEEEILAHLLTIESFLCAEFKIKPKFWNKQLERYRKEHIKED